MEANNCICINEANFIIRQLRQVSLGQVSGLISNLNKSGSIDSSRSLTPRMSRETGNHRRFVVTRNCTEKLDSCRS